MTDRGPQIEGSEGRHIRPGRVGQFSGTHEVPTGDSESVDGNEVHRAEDSRSIPWYEKVEPMPKSLCREDITHTATSSQEDEIGRAHV